MRIIFVKKRQNVSRSTTVTDVISIWGQRALHEKKDKIYIINWIERENYVEKRNFAIFRQKRQTFDYFVCVLLTCSREISRETDRSTYVW